MTLHLGNVPASSTLYIPFATYGTNGESLTMSGLAVTDIEIYKNGSVTQRSSDAGYALLDTDGIDFDGITGIHGFSVDLSDNTDAGFYAVGSFYWVVVSAVTVNTQTVNFIAATFRIVAAEAVTGKPKVDVDAWLGTAAATPTVAGVPEVDLTHIAGSAVSTSTAQLGVNAVQAGGTAWGSGAITAAAFAADAITAAKIAADVGTEIGTAVWATTTRQLTSAQTFNLTGDITGNLSGSVGSVTGAVGSVTGAVGSVTGNVGGNVTGSVGSLATQARTDVRTAIGMASNDMDTQLSGITSSLTTIDNFLDTEVAAILEDTGTTIPAQISALNNIAVADILGATVTEGFSTAGADATLAQMLHEIRQGLGEFSISGTTLTVKKKDGTTSAMTFTLDDATNPTSRTRAT